MRLVESLESNTTVILRRSYRSSGRSQSRASPGVRQRIQNIAVSCPQLLIGHRRVLKGMTRLSSRKSQWCRTGQCHSTDNCAIAIRMVHVGQPLDDATSSNQQERRVLQSHGKPLVLPPQSFCECSNDGPRYPTHITDCLAILRRARCMARERLANDENCKIFAPYSSPSFGGRISCRRSRLLAVFGHDAVQTSPSHHSASLIMYWSSHGEGAHLNKW